MYLELEKNSNQERKTKKLDTKGWGCPIVVGLVILIFWIAMNIGGGNDTSKDYKIEAYACAQMRVEKMLKAPKTAEFEFGGAMNSTKSLGGENFEVDSYVDAENSYGAKIRQNFKCTVKYEADTETCETSCSFL